MKTHIISILLLFSMSVMVAVPVAAQEEHIATCVGEGRARLILYAWDGEAPAQFTKLDSIAFLRGIELSFYDDELLFLEALQQPDVVGAIYGGTAQESGVLEALNQFVASGGRLMMLYRDEWANRNDLLQQLFRVSVPRQQDLNRQSDVFVYAQEMLPYWLEGLQIAVTLESGVVGSFSAFLVTPEQGGDAGYLLLGDEENPTEWLTSLTSAPGDVTFFPPVSVAPQWHYFFDDRHIDSAENEQAALTMLSYLQYCTPEGFRAGRNQFLFVSDRGGDNEIYLMDRDGQNAHNLTENFANDHDPVWLPDGKRIAFVSDRSGQDEIYLMDVGSGNLAQLTADGFDVDGLALSPDGQQFAFASTRDGEDLEIYVLAVDGSSIIQVTDNIYDDTSPTWSSDSAHLAFMTNRPDPVEEPDFPTPTPTPEPNVTLTPEPPPPPGDWEIYVTDIDADNVRQLTVNDAYDGFPAWSPDGTGILFVSDREGFQGAYVMGVGGGAARRLFFAPIFGKAFWSPEGSHVSYGSPQNGFFADVYIQNLFDEGDLVKITDVAANDFNPVWHPAGREIPQDPTRPDKVTDEHVAEVQNIQNELRFGTINIAEALARLTRISDAIGVDGLSWVLRSIPIFEPENHEWIILNDVARQFIGGVELFPSALIEQDPIPVAINLFTGAFTRDDVIEWLGLRG